MNLSPKSISLRNKGGKRIFVLIFLLFFSFTTHLSIKNDRAGDSKDPFFYRETENTGKKLSESALLKFWKIFKNLQQSNEYSSKKKKANKTW